MRSAQQVARIDAAEGADRGENNDTVVGSQSVPISIIPNVPSAPEWRALRYLAYVTILSILSDLMQDFALRSLIEHESHSKACSNSLPALLEFQRLSRKIRIEPPILAMGSSFKKCAYGFRGLK